MDNEETITISKREYFLLLVVLHTAVRKLTELIDADEPTIYGSLVRSSKELALSVPSNWLDALIRNHPIQNHLCVFEQQPSTQRGFKPLVQKSKRRRK